jgi:hypothetical protein
MATPALPIRKPHTLPLVAQAYLQAPELTIKALAAHGVRRPNSLRWRVLLQDGCDL